MSEKNARGGALSIRSKHEWTTSAQCRHALTALVVLLFREVGKTTRVSVRSQMKGDIDEYFSESSSESEEEEESQDRRQVSSDILEGGLTP